MLYPQKRSIPFTLMIAILTLWCVLVLPSIFAGLKARHIVTTVFSIIYIGCTVGILQWKRWGFYGLAGFGVLGILNFMSGPAHVSGALAVLVALTSVLTKEWYAADD